MNEGSVHTSQRGGGGTRVCGDSTRIPTRRVLEPFPEPPANPGPQPGTDLIQRLRACPELTNRSGALGILPPWCRDFRARAFGRYYHISGAGERPALCREGCCRVPLATSWLLRPSAALHVPPSATISSSPHTRAVERINFPSQMWRSVSVAARWQ